MIGRLMPLMADLGHIVAVQPHHSPISGHTWQPVCVEELCGYVGPHLQTESRAQAIAEEHRRKSAGIWKPAR